MILQSVVPFAFLLLYVSLAAVAYFRHASDHQTRLWPMAWRIGGLIFLAECSYYLTVPMNILGGPPPDWLFFLPSLVWLALPFIHRPLLAFLDLPYQQGLPVLLFSICLSLFAMFALVFFTLVFIDGPLPDPHMDAFNVPIALPFFALCMLAPHFSSKKLWRRKEASSLVIPLVSFSLSAIMLLSIRQFQRAVVSCIAALGFEYPQSAFYVSILPLSPVLLALAFSPFLIIARRTRPQLKPGDFLLCVFFGTTLGYCAAIILIMLLYSS